MLRLNVHVPDANYHQNLISCQVACPVHTDARGYVRAIADGRFEEAYLIARGAASGSRNRTVNNVATAEARIRPLARHYLTEARRYEHSEMITLTRPASSVLVLNTSQYPPPIFR
jgi:hypothetical protein